LQLFLMALGVVGAGQFLEGNFLSPKLVGGSVGLHPVWLMFALLAGGALFGFAGLIVAVPVAAALGVLLRFAFRRYRQTPFYLGREQNAALISAAVISAKAQKEP
jgi:predicted PurR-regulated permease PerM